jgi:hypothetical protein
MHLQLFVDPFEHSAPALHRGTAVGSKAKRKRTFDPVDCHSLDAGQIEWLQMWGKFPSVCPMAAGSSDLDAIDHGDARRAWRMAWINSSGASAGGGLSSAAANAACFE